MKSGLFIVIILISGCAAVEKRSQDRDEINFGTKAEAVPVDRRTGEFVEAPRSPARPRRSAPVIEDVTTEVTSSNAVTKNDSQGVVGAQFNKVAEKIVDGDLLKVQKVADAKVQAGVANRVEDQTISAGRDSTTTTTTINFPPQVYWIIAGFCTLISGIVTAFIALLRDKERSRERSEKRANALLEVILEGKAQ